MRYINSVTFDGNTKIQLNGKNLILTGANGSGKTKFINYLHTALSNKIQHRKNKPVSEIKKSIATFESLVDSTNPSHPSYLHYKNTLSDLQNTLAEAESYPLEIQDVDHFVVRYHDKKAMCINFEATRQATISKPSGSVSKEDLIKKAPYSEKNSAVSIFESYLVSQKTMQAYSEAPSIENNQQKAKLIKAWFDKLEQDFQELFEDRSLRLTFNSNSQSFLISQKNKQPFSFQTLSSGFSSILSIYAEMFTRAELWSVSPIDLDGVVFIDEIDAHLHISLQRKIFHFLVKSFSNVQFIISTHSPFVLSSVSDAIIFDLGRKETISTNLSMYSYSAVVEGIFGSSTKSQILEELIAKLSTLLSSETQDLVALKEIIDKILPFNDKLDGQSKSYLLKGINAIIDNEGQ